VQAVSKQLGYYEGAFSPYDIAATLAYKRSIKRKLNFCAVAHAGLIDIKLNNFFNQEYFERNIGLKLTFIYEL
jgi:hypothetical protein